MKREDIRKILEVIGAEKVLELDDDFKMSCIFAPWTHKRGEDRRPSMGIRISSHGSSPWNCFACKAHGWGLKGIVWKLEALSGKKFNEVYPLINVEPSVKLYADEGTTIVREKILPESILDPFRGVIPKYVLNRGITPTTCRTWELGYDRTSRRLTIPVRRGDGQLIGLVGRTIDRDVEPKYFNYEHFKKSWYLFGEQFLVAPEAIVVVEGQFDAMWLWQQNIRPTVALMGSALSHSQMNKLVSFGVPIFLFLDNDEAGKSGIESALEMLANKTKTYVIVHRRGKEPTDYTNHELVQLIARARLF